MSNILEVNHFLAAMSPQEQEELNDKLGSRIQGTTIQKINKKTALDLSSAADSDGLKITVATGNNAVSLAKFKRSEPLSDNQFAITKQVLQHPNWFSPNSKIVKVSICRDDDGKVFLIINSSEDDAGDGGDGTKVKVPAPEA
ncbi:hypothetical protein [Runella aurantiaca]|uniref:Uncharacterized protein n=1 Tax=Runella aurantiaca TaxID=2282308 RepID=A0A369I9R3_9BACT|nr:hypothetical protein [Runella aurantiaca]RDB04263.1 hypothetical protein DVG78_19955 [Runella aurantiaca]